MPPTPVPDPLVTPRVAPEPVIESAERRPVDTSFEARMQWPYLSQDYVDARALNGRELGSWIAGHFFGRQMHGERGLRVEVPEPYAAGVAAVLLDHGLIVQRYTFTTATVTLDVWAF